MESWPIFRTTVRYIRLVARKKYFKKQWHKILIIGLILIFNFDDNNSIEFSKELSAKKLLHILHFTQMFSSSEKKVKSRYISFPMDSSIFQVHLKNFSTNSVCL